MHKMTFILSDGDTYATLFGWFKDWLVKIETTTDESHTGYLTATDEGVALRTTFRPGPDDVEIPYEQIQTFWVM